MRRLAEFLPEFDRTILEAGVLVSGTTTRAQEGAMVGAKEEESYDDYRSQLCMVEDQLQELEATNPRNWANKKPRERSPPASASASADRMDWEPTPKVSRTGPQGECSLAMNGS